MLAPVNLDHKPGTQAGKVEYVPTHWNLTAEAKAVDLLAAELGPEMVLGISHLGAQAPGTLIFVARGGVQVRHIESNPLPDPPP
jgi:hypothetical protein